MDPINNPTPSPNPNPNPAPSPTPGSAPTPGMSSGAVGGGAPAMPPAAPVTPGAAGQPGNPVAQPSGMPVQPPVNPIVRPSGMGVTDPIMMPEKPREPDPVEEELKAPMKAAAPVPGSIGSAVNGPSTVGGASAEAPAENPFANSGTKPTPSVAFTDPAAKAETPGSVSQPIGSSPKLGKKNNKMTLIILIAVAAVVVVVLAIVLIMQLTGGSTASSGANGSGTVAEEEEPEETVVSELVICTTSQAVGDGTFNAQTVTVVTGEGRVLSVDKETAVEDEEGFAESKEIEETSLVAVTGKEDTLNTAEEQFVSEDGDVLVTLDKFSERLEAVLNENGGATFTCETA